MARIQEYLPQEGAQGPQGGTSPALEAVGQLGAGVEKLGREVSETGNTIEQHVSMLESADAQAAAAETKSNFYDRIKEETNNGSLDQNKIFEDYDKWVDDNSGKFSTSRGKAEFERASGRIKGSIIRWSAQGQAQITGAQAVEKHNITINSLSDLTQKDPHSFADNMGQLEETYKGYQTDANMNKNPMALQKMKQADQAMLASAAVQGQMNIDFDAVVHDMTANGGKVDPTDPKYGLAKGMLDRGVYDQYLNSAQKEALQKNIRTNFSAAQTEGQRVLNVQKQAAQDQIDEKFGKALPLIVQNKYSVQQAIADFKGDPKAMEHAINLVRKQQEPSVVENSPGFNHIIDRINSDESDKGHISTPEQIRDAMRQSGIPPRYYQNFTSRLNKSPDGEANKASEKNLIDYAKKRLESVGVNGMDIPGQKNPYAGVQLQKFTLALDAAKQEAIKNKEPLSSLFDPSNPKSMYRKVEEFHLPPEKVLESLSGNTAKNQFPGQESQAQKPSESVRVKDANGKTFKASRAWLDAHPKSGYEEVK